MGFGSFFDWPCLKVQVGGQGHLKFFALAYSYLHSLFRLKTRSHWDNLAGFLCWRPLCGCIAPPPRCIFARETKREGECWWDSCFWSFGRVAFSILHSVLIRRSVVIDVVSRKVQLSFAFRVSRFCIYTVFPRSWGKIERKSISRKPSWKYKQMVGRIVCKVCWRSYWKCVLWCANWLFQLFWAFPHGYSPPAYHQLLFCYLCVYSLPAFEFSFDCF